MNNRLLRKAIARSANRTSDNDGYVLPLVIISGLILAVGAMMLSARSFTSLIHSIQHHHKEEAQEIAESGIAVLLNELNNQFPYLLTISCQVENNARSEQFQPPQCTGWDEFQFGDLGGPLSACAGRSSDPAQIMDRLDQTMANGHGYFRLRNYEFLGDQIQGGTAIIQVQGLRLKGAQDNPEIAASAIVEQEVTIVPKCCNRAPYDSCGGGWGFGLATKGIQLQLGDVIDANRSSASSNANVHCIDCDDPPSDQCQPWTSAGQIIGSSCSDVGGSIIDGTRSNGPLDIPPAPTWNTAAWGDPPPLTISGGHNPTFRHRHDHESRHPINGCFTEVVEGRKRTHCRILTINLSGNNEIKIRPDDGDIRFYVESNQLNLSGRNFANTGSFGQFSIFGGEATRWPYTHYACGSKQLNISGGSEIRAFLHMPCFNINLSGGTEIDPIKIIGSAISNQWNATGDYARLIVPDDVGKIICNSYQICDNTGSGAGEFVALGSNRWNLIQMQKE